jgi:CIC family chloride channel protein|tara:strand:- start:7136 stop:8935 length:1800 start_codon:yes stop_codon:yes gene_type:complete
MNTFQLPCTELQPSVFADFYETPICNLVMKLLKFSIRTFRRRLASIDSVPQFAILGIASGFLTGLVIIAFRLAIEWPLDQLLENGPESFETLDPAAAFSLPVAGAILLVLIFTVLSKTNRRVGVIHVIERLARHQGHMPLKNALAQFITGVVALASGQPGGREGPAIHLGAAGSSLIGQYLQLPNNSVRVLVGCGAAAAISASFNTPIAGVIFSMEVIVMEYTIAGFIPVILASVVAAMMTQIVFGSLTAFDVPPVVMSSFIDIPILVVEGAFIGVIAAAYVRAMLLFYKISPSKMWQRVMTAGFITGTAALILPEVLGIGYDTVNLALLGELSLALLLTALVLKLILSSAIIALGIPVGFIGPTLFMGAMAGGMFAFFARFVDAGLSDDALFVMLGMGAMMGAVLQAPLAALMAVLELTNSPGIILPAMLVIIIANMTASQVFGVRSLFLLQMEVLGLEFRQNPLSMALNRASVASIMTRSFARVAPVVELEAARLLVVQKPYWLLVNGKERPAFILRTEDLAQYLSFQPEEQIDLTAIPATRKDVTSIFLQATLSEALDSLNQSGLQALFVNRISAPLLDSPVGILTREDIESFYQS